MVYTFLAAVLVAQFYAFLSIFGFTAYTLLTDKTVNKAVVGVIGLVSLGVASGMAYIFG